MKILSRSGLIYLLLPAFMLFAISKSYAQSDSCVTTFQKTYGGDGDDEAFDIITIALDHTVFAGRSSSGSAGDYDGLVGRLSDAGVLLWSRTIGGTAFDEFRKLKADSEGNFVCIGSSKSTINNTKQAWVVKLSSSGELLWSRLFHPGGSKEVTGKDLVVLSDGGYAFTSVLNEEQPDSDGWVVKLDKNGGVVWDKLLDNGKAEGFYGISEIKSSIYVGGYCSFGNKDALLLKLNSADGLLQWSKTFEHGTDIHEEILELQNRDGKLSAVVYMTLSGHPFPLFKIVINPCCFFCYPP